MLRRKLKRFILGLVYIQPNLRDFELHDEPLFVGSGANFLFYPRQYGVIDFKLEFWE